MRFFCVLRVTLRRWRLVSCWRPASSRLYAIARPRSWSLSVLDVVGGHPTCLVTLVMSFWKPTRWDYFGDHFLNPLCSDFIFFIIIIIIYYSETPHEQPPHEQPPLLWGHIFRHHYIFLTSHLNVNPWWTATPLTWSEASDFGSSHPWRAATQQLLEVASHGIHGWFGCGLTDIHVNHTSGQPWVHRPKACKGVDHT